MDFYVKYFDNEIKDSQVNLTIEIMLCLDKKDIIVKYQVIKDNENLFASKYQLYLPIDNSQHPKQKKAEYESCN